MILPYNPMERRTFLTMAAKLAAGVAIWPSVALDTFHGKTVTVVEREQWSFLLRTVALFGEQVSYGLVTNALYDWLKSLSPAQQRKVQMDNRELTGYGYIDPAQRSDPIYGVNQTAHCAYFPVMLPDQLNGLASFYDFCTLQVNARLAAPSTFGIQQAVTEYRLDRGVGARNAAACFVPTQQQSASFGQFGSTYQRPDEYRTRNGSTVQVHYTPRASNYGEIRVIATNNNLRAGSRRFFDSSYYVNA